MKKLPYSEGTVFLVPLRNGGYARGVIARASKPTRSGVFLFGYFFGPKLNRVDEGTYDNLQPDRAILRVHFGDLGLFEGEWPLIGTMPNWDRSQWPMPDFARRDIIGKKMAWIVRYCDDDPAKILTEIPTDYNVPLQNDSFYGSGAVELKLTNLLGEISRTKGDSDELLGERTEIRAHDNAVDIGVDRPLMTTHYLYFPSRRAAKKAIPTLVQWGFATEDRLGADDVNWLVLAKAAHLEADRDEMEDRLTSLAESLGGEYDGLETEIPG